MLKKKISAHEKNICGKEIFERIGKPTNDCT